MICPLCQSDNPASAQRCRACGAPLVARQSETAPDALPEGTLLAGAYAVESVLGQGGFGITYCCHDRMLDRRVAVKEFFPSGCRRHNAQVEPSRGLSDANFREARAQFLAEARTLARCHHVGIVGVHAAFEANETAYMVMELLHGKTLAQLLQARGGRMNEAEAVGVIERVGAALQFVHELDLLHRDIKPDNIIVCDDGRVMLIDFGTAREFVKDAAQGHTVVVTPGYAPLEQYAKQARRGAFTDIYSLAATLYHLLTGAMPPAASDRAMGVMLRPVREQNSQVSASVARAVERALQMEIARRPQSVSEFLDLLHAPVNDAEQELFFHPQLADLPLDEDDESNGEIPDALAPDALRARQQLWQNAMPAANAQPVKLAPQQTFPLAANSSSAPMTSGGMGGSIRVKKASDSGGASGVAWGVFALLIAGIGYAALVSPRPNPRNAASPTFGTGVYRSPGYQPPSSRNNSAVLSDDQDQRKRRAATRAWNALPVLLPASVQTLPYSKESNAKNAAPWRGAVEFSPDGKRMATIDDQAVLRVMSLPDFRVLRSLALDKNRTSVDAMFSPDNQTIAVTEIVKSGGSSYLESINRVSVWSVRTGKQLGTFATNEKEEAVSLQAVLNDGQLLLRVTSFGQKQNPVLFLWNPKTGKRGKSPFFTINVANWGYGVISPNGKEFVIGDRADSLRWMDLKTGKQKAEHTTKVTGADYIRQFGTSNSELNSQANMSLVVRGIDYSLNGAYLASRNDGEIRVFDAGAKEIGSLIIDPRSSMIFSVSPDGKWLAAEGNLPYVADNRLLWNVKTGQKIRLQSPSPMLLDFGFSQDGKQLYGIFGEDGHFQSVTWQVDARPAATFKNYREVLFQLPKVDIGPFIPLAQTDQLFAIATDTSIEINRKSGARVQTVNVARSEIAELGLSPDGRFLAIRQFDGELQLRDVQADKSVLQLDASKTTKEGKVDSMIKQETPRNLAFSPDNRLWAYARFNGSSTVVELRSLEEKPRLIASFAMKEQVNALKFSPDNKGLVCGGARGIVQWFDVATRAARNPINIGETVFDIAFAARTLVVMGESTTTMFQLPANAKNPLQAASQTKLPSDFDTSRDSYTQSAISADGKLLAIAQSTDSVQIWDLPTKTMLQELETDPDETTSIYGLIFSDDSKQLSVVAQKFKSRRVFVKTWQLSGN